MTNITHERDQIMNRWVVEQAHRWLNRYCKMLVRFDKLAVSYEGIIGFSNALIAFRHLRIPAKYQIVGNSTLPGGKRSFTRDPGAPQT